MELYHLQTNLYVPKQFRLKKKTKQKNFEYLQKVNDVVWACSLMYNEYSNQYGENRFLRLLEIDEMCSNQKLSLRKIPWRRKGSINGWSLVVVWFSIRTNVSIFSSLLQLFVVTLSLILSRRFFFVFFFLSVAILTICSCWCSGNSINSFQI
jgi:hypothetical protein